MPQSVFRLHASIKSISNFLLSGEIVLYSEELIGYKELGIVFYNNIMV